MLSLLLLGGLVRLSLLGTQAFPRVSPWSLELYVCRGSTLLDLVSFRDFLKHSDCLFRELKEYFCKVESFYLPLEHPVY